MGSRYNGNTEFYKKATVEKLTLRDVFSDVFKKHSRADGERLFMAGTSATTPTPAQMLSNWQKPWLFIWVLGFGLLMILLLYVFILQGYVNFALVPLGFLGSFIVPLAVLIFYMEMNIPRNIPLYEVFIMLLVGGVLSLIFTGVFNSFMGQKPAYWAPLTEEPAKLLALCVFMQKPNRRYILNGILVGGAVGAGFAAIETSGYFMGNNIDPIILLMRGAMAPGGHVLWAALYGGALALAAGNEKLRFDHFLKPVFLKYFGAACILHFIWNYPFETVSIPVFMDAKFLILIIAGWLLLITLFNKGIQQVLQISNHALPVAEGAAIQPSHSAINGNKCILYCVSGQYAGQSIPLSCGRITIGRDSAVCNLLFAPTVSGVSRNHCTITADSRGVYLCDNGSTYGTYLDGGVKLSQGSRILLKPGQRFYLANSQTTFELRQ